MPGAVTVPCLRAIGAGEVVVVEVSQARKAKALEIGATREGGTVTIISISSAASRS
jgi:hypothetical protein